MVIVSDTILSEHLYSSRLYIFVYHLYLFLVHIVLSIRRLTVSDYPFDIFKLFIWFMGCLKFKNKLSDGHYVTKNVWLTRTISFDLELKKKSKIRVFVLVSTDSENLALDHMI